jgi:hypothetical protein
MTKKFWLIALIVACTVVFGSCDKSEELSVEQCKLDMNLFNQTYTVNDEGCCVLKGRKPIAAEEIQSKVKGYGWESIATYEVQENGKLSKEEFWMPCQPFVSVVYHGLMTWTKASYCLAATSRQQTADTCRFLSLTSRMARP